MPYTCAPFYDITGPVGRAQQNSTADVMLVQYLLFSVVIDGSWQTRISPFVPEGVSGPAGILPYTGQWTPALSAWIEGFQQHANRAGFGPLPVTGIVEHAGAAWGQRKPRAQNWTTLHALNNLLFLANKTRYCNLPSDSSLPGPVRSELGLVINIDSVP